MSSAPLLWLFLGLGLVLTSIVLWFIARSLPMGILGWVLAGPVAIGTWAAFLLVDNARRSRSWYSPSGFTVPLRVALLVLAFVGVALHAYTVADALSRSVQ